MQAQALIYLSYQKCVINIIDSIQMLDKLGLVIHPEKSVFIPQQRIVFLGFVIDSVKITVTLTEDKILKILQLLNFATCHASSFWIRDIARVIGYLVSSLPAVQYGALYYRYLEMDKVQALNLSKGNFVFNQGIIEMKWRWCNPCHSFNVICHPPVDVTLYSDASLMGWGALMDNISTGGRWSTVKARKHIN